MVEEAVIGVDYSAFFGDRILNDLCVYSETGLIYLKLLTIFGLFLPIKSTEV